MVKKQEYEFTNTWFTDLIPMWNALVLPRRPTRILEIGSFEGQSACYLIENCADLTEMCCIDSWEGGVEHANEVMADVERRFKRNVSIAQKKRANPATIQCRKGLSGPTLAGLITAKTAPFDFVYVDGSHQAPEVLTDAVLAFQLLSVGGLMIFDDYLWYAEQPGEQDLLNMPKLAIDSFVNIFQRKLKVLIGVPMRQLFVVKTAD